MSGPRRPRALRTPLEREAGRLAAVLVGGTYTFALLGMALGLGTLLTPAAYAWMVGCFAAALCSVVLALPCLYLTRVRAVERPAREHRGRR